MYTNKNNVKKPGPKVTDVMIIFEDAFSSMKERFAAQMKKIDEEMTKISNSLTHQSLSTSSSTRTSNEFFNLDFLTSSPLVEGEGENRKLKLQLDVSQFDPSEVTISTLNNKLIVTASHQEKTDNTTILREYRREFLLPEGVDTDSITSSFSKDGVFVVEAPFLAITENHSSK